MRILFFLRSNVYVRNFESTLRLLADRGHRVDVVADTHEHLDPTDLLGRLCREYAAIAYLRPPKPASTRWVQLGVELRKGLDYLRYFGPEYQNAPKLRMRAELKTPVFAAGWMWKRLVRSSNGRRLLAGLLRLGSRAVPADSGIVAFVLDHRPDLVVVTPLVEPGSPQSDYLRSARSLGIRTALCVYSWDNLTNKGLIHDPLDLVTVWNEPMKREAVALHGVAAERVVVTGAAAYDHWFTWAPRADRQAFCARVGLDARRPYLLYLCSSRFIAPDELPFVRRWVGEFRTRSAVLREAGVLVRPHPQNAGRWREADLGGLANVAVWPREGANPADEASRADYYDSIYHSAAVVGVNTSAQIESAIVGRGVHASHGPEFRDTQDGTLHFHHLRTVNGGVLQIAADMDEHVAQLERSVQDPDRHRPACRRFVEAFVRPHGIGEPATPRLVAALEAAAGRARPDRGPWWNPLVRPALARAAAAVERAAAAAHDRTRERKERPRKQDDAGRSEKASRIQVATAADDVFPRYLRVRDQMQSLRLADLQTEALTARERQIRAGLIDLWEATPGAIAELRRFGEAISGVRAADYAPANRRLQERLDRDLRRLLQKGDPALWVDEPAALGGFGFNGRVGRYNEDTLWHFRALLLLQDAALLSDFRAPAGRRTAWEIGAGWGGFACQFKTLCPNVTYLITGPSERLLLSAVYLTTVFPSARLRVYDAAQPAAFWRDWDDVDFAFAPESAVAEMRPPSLDLALDFGALGAMTPERATLHAHRAHNLGCRYVLSTSGQQPFLDRFYWPHPVCAPGYVAKRLAIRAAGGSPDGPAYFLGWRRLHT